MSDLSARIARLEDIEAIKQLKASYFHACDRKDICGIRSCFAEGDILIDYGAIGNFNNREQLIEIFEEMAIKTGVIDAHHGQNPRIEWHNESAASGVWDLYFYQVNPEAQTVTQLTGYYHDKYQKKSGKWEIIETLFNITSSVVGNYQKDDLKILFAGIAPSA
ncbi:MAG: nuclear transport factor 2 family protein [Pseudomonadales bacterium]|nr:nuclear transport factor 2 family protein [Pseudomonadales bacterium]